MKKLILITIVTITTTLTAQAACELNFQVKKAGAKTAYAEGVSVSSKIRTALESQCKINYEVMTDDQVKSMTIENLEKRLAKLKS